MLEKRKRGSIPITALVILTIALFSFALLAFFVSKNNILNKIESHVSFVEEFNSELAQKEFRGEDASKLQITKTDRRKIIGIFTSGNEFVEISVKRIP